MYDFNALRPPAIVQFYLEEEELSGFAIICHPPVTNYHRQKKFRGTINAMEFETGERLNLTKEEILFVWDNPMVWAERNFTVKV